MINKYLITIVCLFLAFGGYSQQTAAGAYSIEGMINDSVLNEPVEMAAVALHRSSDSTFVQGTASDSKGFFYLKSIKPASYYITITYMGYKAEFIPLSDKRFSATKLNLGKINLKPSDIELASVVITAEIPELVVKEDTLEYNAAAFKLTESAMVEDLLKRLPGVEVDSEGKISTATGKEVRRVFVDGKEFFGNDPKMATKNLTADIVDKVQVVEKKSDLAILTGVEDDDPETIINITIKKGMKKGWMGNITAGMGGIIDNTNNEDARYNANGNINRFTEQDQFAFVANANNINNRTSTDQGNTVRSSRGARSGGSGITSSNTLGINTNNIINDKLKVGGNIAYNYSDNYNKNNTLRQNFVAEQLVRSASKDQEYSNNISFDGKLEYKPDSATTMIFTPSLSYNSSTSHSWSDRTTMEDNPDSTLINKNSGTNSLRSDGFQMRMQFDISRKLSQTGRRISLSGWYNLNNSKGKGVNLSEVVNYKRDTYELLDQRSRTDGDRDAYNIRLAYVEPVGKGRFINFSYNIQVNKTINERMTYNYDSLLHTYSIIDTMYSRGSETRSTTHNIRLNFNSNQTKYSYNVGISISPIENKSKSILPEYKGEGMDSIRHYSRHTVNYSPFVDFTYRLNPDRMIRRNLRFRYNGRTVQPSISQLDPNPNNTNSLSIRTGNPDLLPAFNHDLSLQFNNNNRESQHSLMASLSHTFVQNQIINYTIYDDGKEFTSPINQNGFWNSAANVLYSLPLDNKKKLRFSIQTRLTYNNQIAYSRVKKGEDEYNSEKNTSNTLNLNQNLNLSYSNDWYYGQLRGAVRYANTKYSLENISRKESYNYSLTYNTQITLPYSISIASDITYTGNSGLTAGYNQNEVMWNAELNIQFLKRKQGSLRLQVTDILQQRLNIRRTAGSNYLQDSESTTLSSYFLVSFAYRFNNVGGGRGNRRSGGGDNSPAESYGRERGERNTGGGRGYRNF